MKERLDKEYNKLLRKIERDVNVDDYGADPTGVNDSTEAFKKAIGNGKVRLNLSAGTYIVKGIKLPSWTDLIGQGMGVTTIFRLPDAGSALMMTHSLAGVSSCSFNVVTPIP
ncbi:glycosyl hydrolase family 28-related protein [Bacillus amyloliquefaciens]|uniref:glycosyl hydrolase family 28-related protein n=1 Tax=Bacillus amyloliquefaciens TaxID=1390 RepID=UPI003BF97A3F